VFEPECTISGYQGYEALILLDWNQNDVKHSFYFIGPNLMFGCVSGRFNNLWHVKNAILVFEPECTISGYQSCEEFILLDWNQNNVWECFGAFR
jgi:hypothetical protein